MAVARNTEFSYLNGVQELVLTREDLSPHGVTGNSNDAKKSQGTLSGDLLQGLVPGSENHY